LIDGSKKKVMLLCMGIVIYAMLSTIFGPVIPKLMSEFNVDFTVAGIIVSTWSFGAMACFFTGKLPDKYGAYKMTKITLIFMAIFTIFMGLSRSLIELVIFSFLLGIASGTFDTSFNQVILDMYPNSKGTIVTITHAFFGVGATLGPTVTTITIVSSNNWRTPFLLYGVIMAVISCYQFVIKSADRKMKTTLRGNGLIGHSLIILAVCILIDFTIGTGINAWLTTYLVNTNKANYIEAGIIASSSWAFLAIGRFFVGRIADKNGFRRTLVTFMIIGATSSAVSIFFSGLVPNVIIWGIVGLSLGPVYPLVLAIAYSKNKESPGTAIGKVVAIGNIGGLIAAPLYGTVSNLADANIATLLIPVCFIILTILFLKIKVD
jgi:MFS family permease